MSITKTSPSGKSSRPVATGPAILQRIVDISNIPDTGIKMSIYGPVNSGKTTLACSFPGKRLIIGAEDGRKSVKNVEGEFVTVRSTEEVQQLLDHFGEKRQYETFIIDTMTALRNIALAEVLAEQGKVVPKQLTFGAVDRSDWMQVALKLKTLIDQALDVNANVLFLSHQGEYKIEEQDWTRGLSPRVTAGIGEGTADYLHSKLDYIGRTFSRELDVQVKVPIEGKPGKFKMKEEKRVKFYLQITPDSLYFARFRDPNSSKLPKYITDPTYDKLAKLMKGEKL